MNAKKQFKLYLDETTIEQLEKAAEVTGRRSGQEIVEELIARYLPVFLEVRQAVERAVNQQISDESAALTKQPAKKKRDEFIRYEATDKIPVLGKTGNKR